MDSPGALWARRCSNHEWREAVARCPGCRRYCCRECVTEHEERLLCASCLAKLAKGGKSVRGRLAGGARAVAFLAGLALAWFFFLLIGRVLLAIPDRYHSGAPPPTSGSASP